MDRHRTPAGYKAPEPERVNELLGAFPILEGTPAGINYRDLRSLAYIYAEAGLNSIAASLYIPCSLALCAAGVTSSV